MTDELDALRAALKSTPVPDAPSKAADLALAMENFDKMQAARQGSPDQVRLDQDRHPQAGFLTKVRMMLKSLSTRPILTATTSAAALMLGVALVLPLLHHPLPPALQKPEAEVAATAPTPPLQKPQNDIAAITPAQRPAPKPATEDPLPLASPPDAGASADKAAEPAQADAAAPPSILAAPEAMQVDALPAIRTSLASGKDGPGSSRGRFFYGS